MTNFSKKWKNGQWNAWSAGQPDYKDCIKTQAYGIKI